MTIVTGALNRDCEENMTLKEAIARSISHNEIVTLPYDADACVELEALAEDSAESQVFEFWGTDESGNEWRVHVSKS